MNTNILKSIRRNNSLRKRSVKLVTMVIPKSDRTAPWITGVLGSSALGLVPFVALFYESSDKNIDIGTAVAWMAGIVTVIAAVFGLIIAISAFVVGVDLPGEEREILIRRYVRKDFAAVFAQGMSLLISSIIATTLVLIHKSTGQLPWLILTTVISFLLLAIHLAWLLFVTMRTLFGARQLVAQQYRLIEETLAVLRQLSIEKVSQKLLADTIDTRRAIYWEHSLPPRRTVTIGPGKSGVVYDIDIRKFTRWINSLEVPEDVSARAILAPLRLGKFIGENDWLATLNSSNTERDELLKQAVTLRDDRSDSSLSVLGDTLASLSSDSIEYVQSGNIREFSDLLKVLFRFYEKVLKVSQQIVRSCGVDLRSDMLFVSSWTSNLHKINVAIVGTNGDRFVGKWLDFLFKLISLTKETQDPVSIHGFYAILASFCGSVSGAKLQVATAYLSNYTSNLLSEFANAQSEVSIRNLSFQIRVQTDSFIPRLVVGLPPDEFDIVARWSEIVSSINLMGNNASSSMKQTAIDGILRSRIQLFLGYGGWLIKKYLDKKISTNAIQTRIEYLINQCGSIADLWGAFSTFSDSGMLWSTIDDMVDPDSPAATTPKFIDPYAGSQRFFVLAGTKLVERTNASIPPDEQAWSLLNITLDPVFKEMDKDPERWAQLVRVSLDTFKRLFSQLTEQIRFSAHKGEVQTYFRIKNTPLDKQITAAFVEDVLQPPEGALQIFEKLKNAGQVTEHMEEAQQKLTVIESFLPKESFISSGDHIELVNHGPTIFDVEDNYVLHFVEDYEPWLAGSDTSVVQQLREAQATLASRGTPASIILGSFDWRIWESIREAGEYDIDENGNSQGTFAGVPMFYFPRLWGDKKMFVVASLESWLRVDVWNDSVTHSRFGFTLAECSPEEVAERIRNGFTRESRVGEAFSGEDLKTVAACELKYQVWDNISVTQRDSGACVRIDY